MCQDLDSRVRDVASIGNAEPRADVVRSRCGIISLESKICEVATLLGHVQNEVGYFEVRLRDGDIKNSLTSGKSNRDSLVDTHLASRGSSKEGQRSN